MRVNSAYIRRDSE